MDFLLEQGRARTAIEVKSVTRLRPDRFRGLKAMASRRGKERRVLVYFGKQALVREDGAEVWPLEKLVEWLANFG